MKPAAIIAAVFITGCLGYLLLSSFGMTNSYFGWDARHSAGWLKIFSVLGVGAAAVILWLMGTGRIEGSPRIVTFAGVCLVLGFLASTGFKGTAGDIKQTVTCFQNPDGSPSLDGKVDPDCLKKYYNNFYHFDKDTELWNYVVTYRELPGVNNWAYNIRFKKTPPSTAPRANEEFEYHTGAYEMDLKDKLK